MNIPPCACPVISAFVLSWISVLESADRDQILSGMGKSLEGLQRPSEQAPLQIEKQRCWMALDWLCREQAPVWLEVVDRAEEAELCRLMPEVRDVAAAAKVLEMTDAARMNLGVDFMRAWDHRQTIAVAAGWAARDAATIHQPTGDALIGSLTWLAAGTQPVKLRQTVERLQTSALGLLRRMIAVGASS